MSSNIPLTDFCIECKTFVRPRQEALQCYVCTRWQHCTCHRDAYRKAVKAKADIDWSCSNYIIVDQPLPTEQQPRPLSFVAYSDSESDHDLVSQRPATPVTNFNNSDTGLMSISPDIIVGRPNIFSDSDSDTGQVLSSPDILIGRPNLFSDSHSDS
ncbi:Hypothetical predicted protein [Mytilus galloprovincialis]|uniref:Uncharacterized protein n=1 Tax=Mytilus galloprovincialis TaxID=29158 RepID=A0A8B6BL80_MYTGA|nr:Hypothetical predicted protein [Mytilus galloprovincialis]